MRTVIFSIALVFGTMLMPAPRADHAAGGLALTLPAMATLQAAPEQNPQPPQINVEVNKGGGRVWYASPVWVAIGVIALVLVVMLIVMAARGGGGGTTVVRG